MKAELTSDTLSGKTVVEPEVASVTLNGRAVVETELASVTQNGRAVVEPGKQKIGYTERKGYCGT